MDLELRERQRKAAAEDAAVPVTNREPPVEVAVTFPLVPVKDQKAAWGMLMGWMFDCNPNIPDFDLNITVEHIEAKPRRLEHPDGTPMLWPTCWDGDCENPYCQEGKRQQGIEEQP